MIIRIMKDNQKIKDNREDYKSHSRKRETFVQAMAILKETSARKNDVDID